MNLWSIAWRSVRQRGLASLLTMTSMALGVGLVVIVLSIHGVVTESFRANSTLGYHLIVGARGGALQLTLNSVFYLSQPVENVPYEYYLAFQPGERRSAELKNSIAYRVVRATDDSHRLMNATGLGWGAGPQDWLHEAFAATANETETRPLGLNTPGMFSNLTGLAIPLCLGDYFSEFRVVGTTPDLFDSLVYDFERGLKYQFAEGRNFQAYSEENGFFECVVGSVVARKENVKLGDRINPIHGDPSSPGAHEHAQSFIVVGILAPSGTPNDRAVFVNMEGFFLINDHANPVDEDEPQQESKEEKEEWQEFLQHGTRPGSSFVSTSVSALTSEARLDADALFEPLPIEQREVTSILVLGDDELTGGDMAAIQITTTVNKGVLEGTLRWSPYRPAQAQRASQACQPIREIDRLFQTIVGPIQSVLLILTVLICVVSGVSILVSIYNSMSERRSEIAVMRALGASRETILSIVLIEAVILAICGGGLGWLGAHTCNWFASPLIEGQTGVSIGFFDMVWGELALLPGLFVLAVLVGLYPAVSAYFTDVSKSLGK